MVAAVAKIVPSFVPIAGSIVRSVTIIFARVAEHATNARAMGITVKTATCVTTAP